MHVLGSDLVAFWMLQQSLLEITAAISFLQRIEGGISPGTAGWIIKGKPGDTEGYSQGYSRPTEGMIFF